MFCVLNSVFRPPFLTLSTHSEFFDTGVSEIFFPSFWALIDPSSSSGSRVRPLLRVLFLDLPEKTTFPCSDRKFPRGAFFPFYFLKLLREKILEKFYRALFRKFLKKIASPEMAGLHPKTFWDFSKFLFHFSTKQVKIHTFCFFFEKKIFRNFFGWILANFWWILASFQNQNERSEL